MVVGGLERVGGALGAASATVDVVATTPLGGGDIDVSRVPGAVWQTGAQDIQTFNDTTITETLARQVPGVTVGNVSGNDFQPDVSYRGFDATPVTGTPIGLAVYQNGVRINEAFGDTVNWDLIPENAIDKMTIRAPLIGTVLQVNAKAGELASPSGSQPLVLLGDVSALRVRAELDERDFGEIKIGQPALVRAAAFRGRDFAGKVSFIAPLVEPARINSRGQRNVTDVDVVEVLIDLAEPDALAVGMKVDVYFRYDNAQH